MLFPEIQTIVLLSTANISLMDSKNLASAAGKEPESVAWWLPVVSDEYSHTINLNRVIEIEDIDYNLGFYSEQLQSLIRQAHSRGYNYLKFDCDGETLDGLEAFDW